MPAKFSLRGALQREAAKKPDRIIVHGPEGVGKTSFAAFAPKPFFLTVGGETGLETLMSRKLVPQTDHAHVSTWEETLEALTQFRDDPELARQYLTLCTDSLSALERLAQDYICRTKFKGDWSESGFAGFAKGLVQTAQEWSSKFLPLLDEIRERYNIQIVLIAHTQVKGFANPTGDDYDRFIPMLDPRTWGPTHQWADMVLFLAYDEQTRKETKFDAAKGTGGELRRLLTERRAAFDAKNRHGLPPQINLNSDYRRAWSQFAEALKVSEAKAARALPQRNEEPLPSAAPTMSEEELAKTQQTERGF